MRKRLNLHQKNKNNPFFYLFGPTICPTLPLFAKDFLGKSERGIYGDVIEENWVMA